MRSRYILPLLSTLLLTACVVTSRPGGGVQIIPILPTLVEMDVDAPYYEQSGYYYYYSNDRWQYATTRNGPWLELPRSHWPRETRWRGRRH